MAGRKDEARRWFQQAAFDLRARWNVEGAFHDTACFLAQQAAEKALKSLLHYRGARRAALFSAVASWYRDAGDASFLPD